MPIALLFDNLMIAAIIGTVAGLGFFVFLMRTTIKQAHEQGKKAIQNQRNYQRRFAIAIGGYVTILLLSVYLLDRTENQILRVILALLPMLPVLYGLWGYMQLIRNLDELQRRIQLEAISFSMGLTGVITFSWGFLQGVGLPPLESIWVFPMMIAFWGIGLFIAQRRYD
ncbi:MAG: hypothetical protein WBC91_03190 [Phototrophicaceae bacterium]